MWRTFLIAAFLLLAACSPKIQRGPVTDALPRAQPAYMQWLMKQSLVAQADELIPQVSQSGRLWLYGDGGKGPAMLLHAAPAWLELNAFACPGRQPLFRALAGELNVISGLGFQGVYLGPTGESPAIWLAGARGKKASTRGGAYGEDAASLKFDPALGDERDFENLAGRAEIAGLELGSRLLSAATGQGPDFFLAARHATGYGGLYAMLEAPAEAWPRLPEAGSEWDFKALSLETVRQLGATGIIPESIARDGIKWASPGGWGSTGQVTGVDGRHRRWLYRYSGSPERAVLLWHDPSGLARRIFSAAVIARAGLEGQSLTGVGMEPLVGLDAGNSGPDARLAAALPALEETAGEIHRYGGWAIQTDPLPPEAMAAVLAGRCDFCRDAATPCLIAYALLTGDAEPLAASRGRWKGLDQKRLGSGLNDWQKIHWRLLLADLSGQELLRKAEAAYSRATGKNSLPETPGEVLAGVFPASGNGLRDAERFYDLFLAWRLGLPGLAFVSNEELREFCGFQIAAGRTSAEPAAGGKALFPDRLRALLLNRKRHSLALGEIAATYSQSPGMAAVLSKLPEGGYWLMACNFGRERGVFEISLPEKIQAARDAATNENLGGNLRAGARKFSLALDGRQARHVLLHLK